MNDILDRLGEWAFDHLSEFLGGSMLRLFFFFGWYRR
jgi:hypothetical protein